MTAKFTNTSKQGYPVIYRGQKAVVLFRQDAHDPYVVAHGYDEKRGDWSQGSYFDDLRKAMIEADGMDTYSAATSWEPDPDYLKEAAKRLAADAALPECYYERFLIAATEWYAQCYLENFQELIAVLHRDADIDWLLLNDCQRTSLLAGIAHNHAMADWANIEEKGDFASRRWSCIADDIASDPDKYLDLLDD